MKTKKKLRISLTITILVPVLVLWVIAIGSNMEGLSSVRSVNKTATEITDNYMLRITELSDLQNDVQVLHKMALSHIIATDLDTLVNLVDSIKAQQVSLDKSFAEYIKNYFGKENN